MSKNALSKEHIQAIGALVVAVTKLDSVLTDLVAVFMRTNVLIAITVVHHQQTTSKIDSLLALSRALLGKEETYEPIHKLISEARAIADFRNTMVHAYWTIDANGIAHAVRFSARGEIKRTKTPYSSSEIQARADEAGALVERLAELRDQLWIPEEQDPPEPLSQ